MASVAYKIESSSAPQQNDAVTSWRSGSLEVAPVAAESTEEILSAISAPTLTNVIMAGFIRDNGLAGPENRGRFYVCRNDRNELEGVALIGHTILFEAFSAGAIEGFAAIARGLSSTHLLMGEHSEVQRFWTYYADQGQVPRHIVPVSFLRREAPFEEQQAVPGLRLAVPDDLDAVVRAQAAMAFETSGVDPLLKDPMGFRQRYLRRIEKNRVWVLIENGRLIFKLDVIAGTPDATYIEGVYVSPEERGKGVGRSCLAAAGQNLLEHSKAIYLFVENEDIRTTAFYVKLGFDIVAPYDLLYF